MAALFNPAQSGKAAGAAGSLPGAAGIILLVGASGSGKTSLCVRLVKALAESGARPVGVVCPAAFDGGLKVGIDAVELGGASGSVRLARRRPGFESAVPGAHRGGKPAPAPDPSDPSRFVYGMWSFDGSALAALDSSTSEALIAGAPVAIVDEIGPLELDHGTGFVRTLEALGRLAAAPAGGERRVVFVTARPDIAARLGARWPGARSIAVGDGIGAGALAEALAAVAGYGDAGIVSADRASPERE